MGKSELQSMPLHRNNIACVPDTVDVTEKALAIGNSGHLGEEIDGGGHLREETCDGGHLGEKTSDDGHLGEETGEGGNLGEGAAVHLEGGEGKVEMYANQVAGHNEIGIFKQNDLVLKAIKKKECLRREVAFYESLRTTLNKNLAEMREFVAAYHGTRKLSVGGVVHECIALEDLTKGFREPCVMDVKIGRRTWAPDATYEKIASEEAKYRECKRDLGFCIPGFQVYKVHSGKFIRFGKEFGKTLDGKRAEDAIRTFLNAEDGAPFCRRLIVQFLAALWRIQHWARNQRSVRLYSSSLLFVYDARRLREFLANDSQDSKSSSALKLCRKESLYRPMSLAVLDKDCGNRISTGFSGQLTPDGPILLPPTSPSKIAELEPPLFVTNNNNSWQKSIHALKRTHSFQNNYDKDMQSKKLSYNYILDDLCAEQKSECWATVKMIDLAHVFPAEGSDVDRNYLGGVESLVRIFEEFLIESE